MSSHVVRRFAVVVLLLSLSLLQSPSFAAITTEGDAEIITGTAYVAWEEGDGSLTITAPTVVQGGEIYIAGQPEFTGTMTIDGGTFEAQGNNINVGTAGIGTLQIINGGTLSSDTFLQEVNVGGQTGSVGHLLVEGTDSKIDLPSTYIQIGTGSSFGTFTIQDGGSVSSYEAFIGGGRFSNSSINSSGIATISGAGSQWAVTSNIFVGSGTGTTGELWIQEGGQLLANQGTIYIAIVGSSSDSSGLVVVEGAGSLWLHENDNGIAVGAAGNGTVIVRDGGHIDTARLIVGGVLYGNVVGTGAGTGLVSIDGLGSQLATDDLVVGVHGTAQIMINNGGILRSNTDSDDDNTEIGKEEGSYGRIVVDGATSQWIDGSNQLIIGDKGTGELTVQNGAVVTNQEVSIGEYDQSHGEIVVRGEGSLWRVGSINMGYEGTGKISVSDGAQLHWIQLNGSSYFGIGNGGEVVLDNGRIVGNTFNDFRVNNAGTIRGNGQIYDEISNVTGGEIRVGNFEKLLIGESLLNSARVEVLQGELEVGDQLLNDSQGVIFLEAATLRASEIINTGTTTVASGLNQIFGDTENNFNANIILTGNSQTTFYDDVQNNGNINVTTGSVATFFGDFSGNGIGGGGTVFLEGDVTPGFSPGLMSYGGDVSLGPLSSLTMELAGVTPETEHDLVEVDGAATLGGQLILDAQAPLGDVTLTIFEAGSISGKFDQTPELFSHVGSGMFLTDITYTDTAVTVSLVENLADFDLDGNVDQNDLDLWEAGHGTSPGAMLGDGDANGDGTVDGFDFLAWQRKFSPGSPELVLTGERVPEPGSFVMLGLAMIASTARRRLGSHR